MRRAETLRSLAAKFRALAQDNDTELAGQLASLADEYERMAAHFRPAERQASSWPRN